MISDYFERPWLLEQMRASCVGPYIDGFTSALAEFGYCAEAIRKYARTAIHFGRWADRRGYSLELWDDDGIARFRRHLSRCRCMRNKGVFSFGISAVEKFLTYLRQKGVIAPAKPMPVAQFAAISEQFSEWMLQHRGVTQSTAHLYQSVLRPFLAALGEAAVGITPPYVVLRIRDGSPPDPTAQVPRRDDLLVDDGSGRADSSRLSAVVVARAGGGRPWLYSRDSWRQS